MLGHRFAQKAGLAVALLGACLWLAPTASAHSHVHIGIGISVPGVTIGAGNCWRCGRWVRAPIYYAPYPGRVYYSAPVYYNPYPVYHGYRHHWRRYRSYHHRYYRYHYRHHYRHGDHRYHGRHGGYYHHGHRHG